MLAAYLPTEGWVLYQVEVLNKENEISAAPQRLSCVDLRGKIVTGDAMFAQRELSAQIVAAGGEYVWTVKDNQSTLWQDIALLFQQSADSFSRALPTVITAGGLLALGLVVTIRKTSPPNPLSMGRGGAKDEPPVRTAAETKSRIFAEIVLLGLIVSPLFFLRHGTPVLIHYQLVALPALAILVGASTLLFRARVWRLIVTTAVIALAAVWSAQIMLTLDDVAINRPPNSALSSILREARDVANAVADPVLFFTHGDDPVTDGEVAVFKTLLWTRDHRILNGENLLILPPYPATLLATLAPFQAWEEIEASGLALDVQTYPRRVGAEPFVATRYDGVSDPQGFTSHRADPLRRRLDADRLARPARRRAPARFDALARRKRRRPRRLPAVPPSARRRPR